MHGVLTKPERLANFAAIATPSDFIHPLHARVAEHLLLLHEAGREPSITSVLALVGDEEAEPGLPARRYLGRLYVGPVEGQFLASWRDTVEAWQDHIRRRKLFSIGGRLQLAALTTAADPLALASEGVDGLDEVIASFRTGNLRDYDALGAADRALAHLEGSARAYPTTGLVDLDRMIGGWPRGQLIVKAGRPGIGKSAIATSVLLKSARKGHAAAFISLEMSAEQIGSRLLTDLAYTATAPIYYQDLMDRRLDERQKTRLCEQREILKGLPLRYAELKSATMAEIASKARRLANDFDRDGRKLDVLCIDHLSIIKASSRYAGTRSREVAEITAGLTALASDLDCAVVALCQLNRAVEGRDNKRPTLSDLRDSGAIEEDASLVLFAYRPGYYLEREKFDDHELERKRLEELERHRYTLELSVQKNRNGRIGTVIVHCDIAANAIRDAAFAKGVRHG